MAKAVTSSGEATKAWVEAKPSLRLCKVAVERSDDGVLTVGIVDMTGPLTDTGTAGISQYYTTYLIESLQETVFLNGITN